MTEYTLNELDELEELRKKKVWEYVTNSPNGREVLMDILSTCGMYQTSLTNVDFHNGKRAIGSALLEHIFTIQRDTYILMLQEQQKRQDALDIQREIEHARINSEGEL